MATDQRISLDHVKAIVDQAVAAGLAQPPASDADAYSFSPVLKAKLGELGVDTIAGLTVDQAVEVAVFIGQQGTP
ncbi:MAG TPA: hypothetical protein VF125_06035 [Solirubrobacterales bacterium]